MNLNFGFCILGEDDKILSKAVTLYTISDENVKEMKDVFNVDAKKEISSVITEQLKLELTEDLIYDMVRQALKS